MSQTLRQAQLEYDKFHQSQCVTDKHPVMVMNPDGSGGPLAVKITSVGSYKYIAKAPAGSSQSDPVWQVMKIDKSDSEDTIISFADGNLNFDNIASDLTVLTYS